MHNWKDQQHPDGAGAGRASWSRHIAPGHLLTQVSSTTRSFTTASYPGTSTRGRGQILTHLQTTPHLSVGGNLPRCHSAPQDFTVSFEHCSRRYSFSYTEDNHSDRFSSHSSQAEGEFRRSSHIPVMDARSRNVTSYSSLTSGNKQREVEGDTDIKHLVQGMDVLQIGGSDDRGGPTHEEPSRHLEKHDQPPVAPPRLYRQNQQKMEHKDSCYDLEKDGALGASAMNRGSDSTPVHGQTNVGESVLSRNAPGIADKSESNRELLGVHEIEPAKTDLTSSVPGGAQRGSGMLGEGAHPKENKQSSKVGPGGLDEGILQALLHQEMRGFNLPTGGKLPVLRLFFLVNTSDRCIMSEYPDPIHYKKWHLLCRSGKFPSRNFYFDNLQQHHMATITSRETLSEEETSDWINKTSSYIRECLLQTEHVFIRGRCCAEILQLIQHELGDSREYVLYMKDDSIQIFTADRKIMDKVLLSTQQFIKSHNHSPEILLKIPFGISETKKMLALGLLDHVKENVHPSAILDDCLGDLVIPVCTDIRRFAMDAIENYLGSMVHAHLQLSRVSLQLLISGRDNFLQNFTNAGILCWWQEVSGQLELLAASPDMAMKAEKCLETLIWEAKFPVCWQSDWKTKLDVMLSKYPNLFKFEAMPDGQGVWVAAAADVAEKLFQDICQVLNVKEKIILGHLSKVAGNNVEPSQDQLQMIEVDNDGPVQKEESECQQFPPGAGGKISDKETDVRGESVSSSAQQTAHSHSELKQSPSSQRADQTGARLGQTDRQQPGENAKCASTETNSSSIPNRQDATQTESDGQSKKVVHVTVHPLIGELLQTKKTLKNFKALCFDHQCFINLSKLSDGYVMVDPSDSQKAEEIFQQFFCEDEIEAAEDDAEVNRTLKSVTKANKGKLKYTFEKGRWLICMTSDIKTETKLVLDKLRTPVDIHVPIPLFMLDFITYKLNNLRGDIKEKVHKAADISLSTGDIPEVIISVGRAHIKNAQKWFSDLASSLEAREQAIGLEQAKYLQSLEMQGKIKELEAVHDCRMDVLCGQHPGPLLAKAPCGQQLLVCQGSIASAECQVVVLPVIVGQTQWTSFQREVLQKGLLAEDMHHYKDQLSKGQVELMCNGQEKGKTVVMIPVPVWSDGKNQERSQILEAYSRVFSICEGKVASVAISAVQSKHLPLSVATKMAVKVIIDIFEKSALGDVPAACDTVIIYTESTQDFREVCKCVQDGIPKTWSIKSPPRPRIQHQKRIKVEIGEIQKTKADVVVNSTNKQLTHPGASSKQIKLAAGEGMCKQCKTRYPNGINEDGLAVTDSGNMKQAKRIYHIALSETKWDQLETEEAKKEYLHRLHQVILKCLLKASEEGHKSIAFPTLGIGVLRYPVGDVAETMFKAVNFFFTEMPRTSVMEVIVVLYHKDPHAIQYFKAEEITHLYTLSCVDEDMQGKSEMRIFIGGHIIQVVQGNACSKWCVSDISIFGELSGKGPTGHQMLVGDSCHPINANLVLQPSQMNKQGLKTILRQALDLPYVSLQIAAQTLDSLTLKAHVVEQELERTKSGPKKLVSIIFSDKEKAWSFPNEFRSADKAHVRFSQEGTSGQLVACGQRETAKDAMKKLLEGSKNVPEKYKKKPFTPTGHSQIRNDDGDNEQAREVSRIAEADSTTASADSPAFSCFMIPVSWFPTNDPEVLLRGLDKNLEVKYKQVRGDIEFTVKTEALQAAVDSVFEAARNFTSGSNPMQDSQIVEKDKHPAWIKVLDDFELEALQFLLGETFSSTFSVNQSDGKTTIVQKHADVIDKVEMLRREDLALNQEEMKKLGNITDAKSEGLDIFLKPLPDQGKVALFGFDYSALTKAKRFVTVKAGRVTARSKRRFDGGNQGFEQVDPEGSQSQSLQSGSQPPSAAGIEFATQHGIRVYVYKTDITKLPVDAIVNTANEHLSHGGGVAAAIARAAGFTLEKEGDDYIRKNGPLKVTEVVPTTAGAMPCQKVLHAVGPRWSDYKDKQRCQDDLKHTVLSCLEKAHKMQFSSLAVSSISSVIFGVPRDICAQMYVLAVKRYDELHGGTTTLRHIHFVDIMDDMVSIIQKTFLQHLPTVSSAQSSNTLPGANESRNTEGLSRFTAGMHSAASPVPYEKVPSSQVTSMSTGSVSFPGGPHSGPQPGGSPGQPTSDAVLRIYTDQDEKQGMQYQFHLPDVYLVIHLQDPADSEIDAIVLWQELGYVFKDDISKKVFQKLNVSRKNASTWAKSLTNAETVVSFECNQKTLVFPVMMHHSLVTGKKMQDLVERALNKADQGKRRAVMIPGYPYKQKATRDPNKDVEEFATAVYTAACNYAKREHKSIKEIHVLCTDSDVLQIMNEVVSFRVAADISLKEKETREKSQSQARKSDVDSHMCVLCLFEFSHPKTLSCGHTFCEECISMWFKEKPTCPSCLKIHGVVMGNQPVGGTMDMYFSSVHLPGHDREGSYRIGYHIPGGNQTVDHPSPGRCYYSISRTAYLPDTPEGRKVLMMLKVAFDRKLTFTVGDSVTTGHTDVITWNGIHHKTSTSGGSAHYGYPDPGYLSRVQEELAAKGVTDKDLTATQKDFIQNPQKYLKDFRLTNFSSVFDTTKFVDTL